MAKTFFDPTVMDMLRAHKPVSAAWAQMGNNISAEILAESGFDVLVVDMEHAPVDLPALVGILQAVKGTGCAPIVRAPWNDMVWIKQILDAGAYGIHVPYVSTREEAEYAVRCCKYAPEGVRGIAGSQRAVNYSLNKADYYKRANRDVMVLVSIETPKGVENIGEIASVEGVDGIFIGPADLSTSMGYLADPSQPEVREAIATIESGTKAAGKFLGTIAATPEKAKELYARGYSLVYFLSDTTELAKQASRAVEYFHKEILGEG